MTSPAPPPEAPLVLIVDDDERNLTLARDVLRAGGLRTLEAPTGGDAVRLAGEHLPDIVLLDLRLPDLDGTEVARRIRNGARTAAVPIVALTAMRLEGDDEWLRAAGFAGYLDKPIDVGAFAEQVRSYCTGTE